MTPSYASALADLRARGRFGIRLGLGRTRALLHALGDPQNGLRGALIAGTNGKGSVLCLTDAALRAAGLRVGATPKPHLVTYRERIQVDGVPVDEATFAQITDDVLAVTGPVARRLGEPTEFELLTVAIFHWFAQLGLDVAVVEVGLGGRLDATHAWDGGVAAITNVGLDHMAQLGDTVTAIAREKAAIIMRGDLAVTGATGDGLAVVRRRARRMGAPLAEATPAPLLGWDRDSITVELPRLGPTRVGLRGRHQAANVAVADAILDALEVAGVAAVLPEARRAGYAAARWPGRLELLDVAGRDVLLDGAHNPGGAATLAIALDDLQPYLRHGDRPLTLLLGVMGDKDVDGMLRALLAGGTTTIGRIVCTSPDPDRGLDPDGLAARCRRVLPGAGVSAERDPATAWRRAIDADVEAPLLVAGSLYLVGSVRGWITGAPPDPAPDPPLPSADREGRPEPVGAVKR